MSERPSNSENLNSTPSSPENNSTNSKGTLSDWLKGLFNFNLPSPTFENSQAQVENLIQQEGESQEPIRQEGRNILKRVLDKLTKKTYQNSNNLIQKFWQKLRQIFTKKEKKDFKEILPIQNLEQEFFNLQNQDNLLYRLPVSFSEEPSKKIIKIIINKEVYEIILCTEEIPIAGSKVKIIYFKNPNQSSDNSDGTKTFSFKKIPQVEALISRDGQSCFLSIPSNLQATVLAEVSDIAQMENFQSTYRSMGKTKIMFEDFLRKYSSYYIAIGEFLDKLKFSELHKLAIQIKNPVCVRLANSKTELYITPNGKIFYSDKDGLKEVKTLPIFKDFLSGKQILWILNRIHEQQPLTLIPTGLVPVTKELLQKIVIEFVDQQINEQINEISDSQSVDQDQQSQALAESQKPTTEESVEISTPQEIQNSDPEENSSPEETFDKETSDKMEEMHRLILGGPKNIIDVLEKFIEIIQINTNELKKTDNSKFQSTLERVFFELKQASESYLWAKEYRYVLSNSNPEKTFQKLIRQITNIKDEQEKKRTLDELYEILKNPIEKYFQ